MVIQFETKEFINYLLSNIQSPHILIGNTIFIPIPYAVHVQSVIDTIVK